MIQGRNMTEVKGMRKGISLVEMLIAIVLFGVIATTSYIYYKNYYDTAFAAKKLAISVIVDQASQLSNAFDMYSVQTGLAPTSIQQMVDARLITQAPVVQAAITDPTLGWVLNNAIDVDSSAGGANDTVFQMDLDGTASAADQLDYCNILTNQADSAWSILPGTSTIATVLATDAIYTLAAGETQSFHCAQNAAGTLTLVFVKLIDTL